jgi:hypothetical protein
MQHLLMLNTTTALQARQPLLAPLGETVPKQQLEKKKLREIEILERQRESSPFK